MPSDRDGGMVTAELAACLPALLLVVLAAVYAVLVADARIRVQDAAREAARAAARGDSSAGSRLALAAAPGGRVSVTVDGSGSVRAVVTLRLHPLATWLPGVEVTEQAVAAQEPGGTPR